MAERLGKPSIDFVDELSEEELSTWQALSIIDDWSGEHRAMIEYRVYMLMMKAAAAICGFCGIDIEDDEVVQFWEVLPLREKPKLRRKSRWLSPEQLRQKIEAYHNG